MRSYLPGPSPGRSLDKLASSVAAEWNDIKNGFLKPSSFSVRSGQKVWWECAMRHEWRATIASRTLGNGCPYCAGQLPSLQNNLMACFPTIAAELHPKKNGDLVAAQLTRYSTKKIWWHCNNDHEWQETVAARTRKGFGCPYCSGRRPSSEYNLLIAFPKLSQEWHKAKNDRTCSEITPGSAYRAWWLCSNGHEFQAIVYNRVRGTGCPVCSRKRKSKSKSKSKSV